MDGKKLLVFSDTHGSVAALKIIFNWAKDRMPPDDTICGAAFLGDGISDLQPAANATGFFCEWKLVSGNNDYGYSLPGTMTLDFGDNCFFMCHGHRHANYGDYNTLIVAAQAVGANAALFGHSHVPFMKKINGILLINPGSVGRPRSRIGATFAVIECKQDKPLKVEFFGISTHGEIYKVKLP